MQGACELSPEPPHGLRIDVLPDVLDLAVFVETGTAEFAAVTGPLHSAPFRLRHIGVVVVDPDSSMPQSARDALCFARVLGPNRAGQPVVGVVGDAYRIVFV